MDLLSPDTTRYVRRSSIIDRMSTIDKLLARMTLAEKLGQLTMTSASYAVTGPVIAAANGRTE